MKYFQYVGTVRWATGTLSGLQKILIQQLTVFCGI